MAENERELGKNDEAESRTVGLLNWEELTHESILNFLRLQGGVELENLLARRTVSERLQINERVVRQALENGRKR
ncbi:MAG TPA: hypothetical protein VD999_02305 [Vitreimonas sp.]|nr:hypothetical protein [Vitreimonas sp.]